jgi:hypoxanthine phosphoribosyltransferase
METATCIAHRLGIRHMMSIQTISYGDNHEQNSINWAVPFDVKTLAYRNVLIIDDILDSGKTLALVKEMALKHHIYATYAVMVMKGDIRPNIFYGRNYTKDVWVKFWWENE